MKRLFLLAIAIIATSTLMNAQNISLPEPNRTGGMPLNDALNARSTHREFSKKMLSEQQLSDLLWAANGINRDNGRRTAPSARNCQEIDVYVFLASGIYLYADNSLNLVKPGDFRGEVVVQPFAADAPVLLIFVANYDKMPMDSSAQEFYGATDAGFVSQNVYLHCASQQLNTVVLGSIHRDKIKEMLGFNGKAILGQSVGFAK